ncbi:MAG: DNA-directed RNA polymerase subunit beta [Clostridia bacterium]|nr:DNA-directed RNA polymerase subunit beta [Clostridia bacterium]MBR3894823.1 DNA-directed RNA polymerase subunit beta [Clostridia bacterium]
MIHVKDQKLGQNTRKSFARSRFDYPLPNLVEIQTKSYEWFKEEGLMEVLRDASPITDYSGNLVIEFISYTLDDQHPKYPVEECKERDVNYAAPLKVNVRLTNKQTGEVKQADIFMGDFPLMTETGTFVINGAERVIVSQIIRSPGMYYSSEIDKAGIKTYATTVIPYRGAWLEYEIDAMGVMYVRIDKNRKLPLTMLIRALGVESREDIYAMFGDEKHLERTLERDESEQLAEINRSTVGVESLKEIYKKLRPGEPPIEEAARTLINNYFFDPKRYDIQPVGRYKYDKKMAINTRIANHRAAEDVVSPLTGELLCEAGTVITPALALDIAHACVNEVKISLDNGDVIKVLGNNTVEPEYLIGCDLKDCGVREKVRIPVMLEIMEACDGDVDAIKEMAKARIADLCPKHITIDDIFASISYLLNLTHDVGCVDDIDHLGNRRIRSVGEQLQNQLRIGFTRMDKIIKERMTTQDNEKLTVQALINIRPVTTAIREFFGSSQLSQFMDQNNPLAELTHKRRLSALGPGGISRDRASFDVRDVHYTQYGRMCPIETPEGPNIGLISYLTTYARISEYGFIEAPYRKVKHVTDENGNVKHFVTDEVEYMTADVEDNFIVAQANEPLADDDSFVNAKVIARDKSEIVEADAANVDYMDVAPKMLVSVATAMIPFLENDDNSRALMGANMQKQAVPLMVTDSPIVGTGMEYKAALDSGVVMIARNAGVVERVQADRIVVACDNGVKDVYNLIKFKRTNQGTCFNQRPLVKKGDRVEEGQVIVDGPATSRGEVALGKNALIGFMTWEGYNYEDAVLLNERLVRDDVYTSLHIEEYTHEARDTKLGPEEITREIPNVGEDALRDLNAEGIVKKGTEVRSGDILVGKTTPKGETELTAEERLLRAIFGEKSREVRDTSLRLAHGEAGIVVDVRVFSHEQGDELPTGVNKVVKVYVAQKRKISVGDKMAGRHGNKGVVSRILPPEDMPFLPDGTPLDIVLNPLGVPSRMNIGQVLEVHLGIASRKLGWKIMTPVFDGANEKDILECLKAAGMQRDMFPLENPEGKDLYEEYINEETGEKELRTLSDEERANEEYMNRLRAEGKLKILDGKTVLYDGRTGEPFDNPVTVGIMYYLKLHHLVDDKIHARSNGPYSLVTQQPLGGKAQFGGQRFGEMEVWALEAYGAAYTLQEILTVKSDDINGRRRAYEAIIKGQNIPTPGVPESFKVMVKELQALALDIRVLDKDGNEIELSELGREEESSSISKADAAAIDEVLGRSVEDDDMRKSFFFEDEDGNALDDEEEEELYEEDDYDSDYPGFDE